MYTYIYAFMMKFYLMLCTLSVSLYTVCSVYSFPVFPS